MMLALTFGVMIACVPWWPDGAMAPRWALISLAPLYALYLRAPIHWASIAAVSFAGVTIAWSPDQWNGLDLWWHFAALAAVVAIAPADMTKVFWVAGIALALNAIVVMMQIDGALEIIPQVRPMSGLFFNRNQQNVVTALVMIGLLSIRDWRAWCLVILLTIPMITLPVQRGPWLALAAAGAFLVCRRWKFLIPAFAILLASFAVFLANDPVRVASLGMRASTWIGAVQHLTWAGNGLGSFRWAYPNMEFAHNDPLQLAYELGAVGVLGWAALLSYNLSRGPIVPRLVLVAFAVEGLFDFPLYQPAAAFLAAMAVGSLVRARAELRDRVGMGERVGWLRAAQPGPA